MTQFISQSNRGWSVLTTRPTIVLYSVVVQWHTYSLSFTLMFVVVLLVVLVTSARVASARLNFYADVFFFKCTDNKSILETDGDVRIASSLVRGTRRCRCVCPRGSGNGGRGGKRRGGNSWHCANTRTTSSGRYAHACMTAQCTRTWHAQSTDTHTHTHTHIHTHTYTAICTQIYFASFLRWFL